MASDRNAVGRTYTDYFKAFQTLDPDAILPYYHTPFMAITPAGVVAVSSPDEGRALFTDMMRTLRERGYARSQWTELGVQALSDSAAMVSCRVTRYKTDGSVLERFGATYAFRRTAAGWKIAMLAMHDADTVLDLPRWEPAVEAE